MNTPPPPVIAPPHAASPASRARYVVLWFATILAVITYVDRVCIAQSTQAIQNELGLDKIQMGYAFTAFGWAYAIFEIPGGWLGDKIGPRKVLMRVVAMWSLFTIATGWAWSLPALIVCRFFFGMGEAGCFPNITRAFSNWFPPLERVSAQGTLWLGARWGGAFTPLLVGWMLADGSQTGGHGLGLHYRWVFLVFGLLGVVWAVAFSRWFRDRPSDHPAVNPAELAHIGTQDSGDGHSMPWASMFRMRTVWMLWGQYFFMSYAWYFYITWFPTYLREHFTGTSELLRALLACVPLFFGGLGSLACGQLSVRLAGKVGCLSNARRILGVGGMGTAGIMLLLSLRLNSPVSSVLAIGMAAFFSDLSLPGAWGSCMDVGGRHTGALAGSMNTLGQVSGALAPMIVPCVLKATGGNWSINILCFAVSYFLGAICWFFIDSRQRLET